MNENGEIGHKKRRKVMKNDVRRFFSKFLKRNGKLCVYDWHPKSFEKSRLE